MVKPVEPVGVSVVTSTWRTCAMRGPRWHHDSILLDERGGPFEHCLDGSIGEIARGTGDAQQARLATARLPEFHSLDAPNDPRSATDLSTCRRHR